MEIPERRRRSTKKPRWPIYLFGLILVTVAISVTVMLTHHYHVKVTMYGEHEITLEYGAEFMDPGASAQWYSSYNQKKKTDLEVTVESNLNLNVLGTYTITYSAQFDDVQESLARTVHVVDTQKPVITLHTNPGSFTVPGEEYAEEGFTAVDNYDGDITDRVSRVVEGNVVIYIVSDSSGNETQVRREIVYDDVIAPVLELAGDSRITITIGDVYTEPGYSALDNVDGDLTARVSVSGSVDPNVVGTYIITYEVTDSYGNTTTATRTVIVEAVKQPDVVEPNGKVIYLTFDDGPGPYTRELLDVLKKYNVKATFFVCKTGYMELLDDIVDEGHAIGMHSVTHRYKEIYASEEAYFADLYGMQDLIYQYTGVKPTILRFPGGSGNGSSKFNPGIMTKLTQAVQDRGFQYFDWNVLSGDAGETTDTDQVVKNIIDGIGKKTYSFVLQHDTQGFSVAAVECVIIWGLENGYTFLPLEPNSPTCHQRVNN